jgi:3,4-dihydroxy 2-butanone 4-phosphate synthase/GTP cyclohydrolase II
VALETERTDISDVERVVAALKAFERGEMVVVVDDDDRENEGDLVLAAVHATPEKLAFIVRHTSGIVCAPMPRDAAHRLRLDPMVANNDAPLGTAFTVSVDCRHGLTTGISAEERCNTVRALANPNSGPDDFVRPGHVFPLIAREGGVLMRSGHTEAAVDLCRLANLPPIGVIAELINDDGTVTKGEAVTRFADQHRLQVVSVADLIGWRRRRERLVQRVAEVKISTIAGPATAISYSIPWDPMQHLAIVCGDIRDGRGIPVRLHLESVVTDVFGQWSLLDEAMRRIANYGRGIVVYLREGSVGVGSAGARARDGVPQAGEVHYSAVSRDEDWREIGLGAQILQDLGVTSVRLLSTRERRYIGTEGFGIEIEATDIIES